MRDLLCGIDDRGSSALGCGVDERRHRCARESAHGSVVLSGRRFGDYEVATFAVSVIQSRLATARRLRRRHYRPARIGHRGGPDWLVAD